MPVITRTVTFAIPDGCECCKLFVDCPGCAAIARDYLFTLAGTGDLAFLDEGTVEVFYVGESGGMFNFFGTAVIDGWTVTVGWGISADTTCSFVAGNITVYKAGECGGYIQEMDDPATTTSLTACDPSTFTITAQQLYQNGEPSEGQCFSGTVGGVGVQV